MYKHKIFVGTADRRASKCAFSDLCVFWREPCQHATHAVPSWHLTCTHNRLLESLGSRFGSPGQKALPAINKFTLLWIFALSLYPRPVPCKDGFISIVFDLSLVCCLFDLVPVNNRPLCQSLPTV